jgi:YihY family inner membrane protein
VNSDPEQSRRILRIPGFARPTVHYWFEVEVHVYALSVAAAVLLSFFPFLIVMVSLCRYIFQWPEAVKAIEMALADFFPPDLFVFIRRNLIAAVEKRGPQYVSLLLLMITANAVFVPFEVALNKAWGVSRNRSYLLNQLVCLGLIFLCGGLALASFALTAINQEFVAGSTWLPSWFGLMLFKLAAVPLSILSLALMYWLLPNRKVRFASILPTAFLVGLALEGLKYLNVLVWPFLKARLQSEYGPFYISVSILLWSFLAAMIILAGAERSARKALEKTYPEDPSLSLTS